MERIAPQVPRPGTSPLDARERKDNRSLVIHNGASVLKLTRISNQTTTIPRRRKVVWIARLLLSALGILALLMYLGREPSEQGRSLSQWLEDLDKPSAATNVQTITAFRRMGAKAATRLVPMLEASDSAFKLRIVELARKQPFVEVRFAPASVKRGRADKAFEMMGKHAVAAAPRLVSLLVRRGARPPESCHLCFQ